MKNSNKTVLFCSKWTVDGFKHHTYMKTNGNNFSQFKYLQSHELLIFEEGDYINQGFKLNRY